MLKNIIVSLNIDTVGYQEKPKKNEIGIISKRLKTTTNVRKVSLQELANELQEGKTITPAVMFGGKSDAWVEQQIFQIDVDYGKKLPPKVLYNKLTALGLYPVIYFETYSSGTIDDKGEERFKYRFLLLCDEVIEDGETAVKMMKGLESIDVNMDKSISNLAKMCFATNRTHKYNSEKPKEVSVMPTGKPFKKEILLDLYEKLDIAKEVNKNVNLINIQRFKPDVISVTGLSNNRYVNVDNCVQRGNIDLIQLYAQFDILNYLRTFEHKEFIVHGKVYTINGCPLCGHNDCFKVFKHNNTFKCFSCGKGGNVLNFIESKFGMTTPNAREYLKYNVLEIDRDKENQLWKSYNNEKARAN